MEKSTTSPIRLPPARPPASAHTSFMQAFFLCASSLPSSFATSVWDMPLSIFFCRSFVTREHTASIVADIVIRLFSSSRSCARAGKKKTEAKLRREQERGGGGVGTRQEKQTPIGRENIAPKNISRTASSRRC